MYPKILYLLLLLCWLLPSGCAKENQPDNLAPKLTINEAQDITRTSAMLSGTVDQSPTSLTHLYRFRYGTSTEMGEHNECTLENSIATSKLQDLLPGTTYYYCLEAGNKKNLIQSLMLSFTTVPNETPKIEDITFLGQGPISIMMECAIIDDGGEPITSSGFCYAIEGEKEKELTSPLSENRLWHLRIGGLEKNANYIVRAFAENKIGRTYSKPFSFRTEQAIIVTAPGTLPDIMDEEEKYEYTELSIAGPLNGTDIRYIRDMLGKDIDGNNTKGKLSKMNMTDTYIVAGGLSYYKARYTEENTIGYGMFGYLEILKEIKLPEETQIIEQDAFKNSIALTKLSIPGKTERLIPSVGCSLLSHISIASNNPNYSSTGGVVYDKNGENLIWFPEGISGDEIQFPSSLKSIGDFALQKCRIRTIVLPNSLISLGKQAFYGAEIESIVLPDKLRTISYGLFQECRNLTSVTLGSDCQLISDYCFDGCALRYLYVRASYPPVCLPEAFTGATDLFSGCVLHVPDKSLDLYKNANVWKQFLKISPHSFELNISGQ